MHTTTKLATDFSPLTGWWWKGFGGRGREVFYLHLLYIVCPQGRGWPFGVLAGDGDGLGGVVSESVVVLWEV